MAANLLTPTSRLVLFCLDKQQPQTLDALKESTGTNSYSALRDAVRVLQASGRIIRTDGKPATFSLTQVVTL